MAHSTALRRTTKTLLALTLFFVPVLVRAQTFVSVVSGQAILDATSNGVGEPSTFKVFLTGNATFSIINGAPGQTIHVLFVQDGIGGRTVTFATNITTPCAITSGSNAYTNCGFSFDSGNNTWSGFPSGSGGSLSGQTPGQIPKAATATTSTSSIPIQGTDPNILSSDGSGSTGAVYTKSASGGATTKPAQGTDANIPTSDGTGITGQAYCRSTSGGITTGTCLADSNPVCTTDTFISTPIYTFDSIGTDQCHIMTLTGNVTSITIAGTPAGHSILRLKFPENGTGGFTVTFPGSFVFPTNFTFNTAANNQNNMGWEFDATANLWRPITDFGGGSGGAGNPPGGVTNDTQCNSGANNFKACVNQPAILYVSTTGNDSNSGKTWDTAKLTIMAAVCALPNGNCNTTPHQAGAGAVVFQSNVACNSVAAAGCWLASSGDSQWPNMTSAVSGPTAWTTIGGTFAINFICATKNIAAAHANRPSCIVKGPDKAAGIGNLPLVWITGNSNSAMLIDGLSGGQFAGGNPTTAAWGRIGIDSTTTEIIGTPTVTQTSSITIENVSTNNITGSSLIVGGGPQLALGNGFWTHFHDFQMFSNVAESCQISAITRTSNVVTVTTTGCGASSTQCPFLVGDHVSIKGILTDNTFNGTYTAASACGAANSFTFNQTAPNSSSATVNTTSTVADDRAFGMVLYSTQAEMARLHMEGNGIKWYGGPNSNLKVHDAYMEGTGVLGQPFIWESPLIYGAGGTMDVTGMSPADTQALPSIINEGSALTAINTQSQSTTITGGGILVNAADTSVRNTGLVASAQSGWYDNEHFEALIDTARRQAPIATNIFPNLLNANPASWPGGTGVTFNSGKRDPYGGTGAIEVDTTSVTAINSYFYQVSQAVSVGDIWYFGGWVKTNNASNTFSSTNQPLFFVTSSPGTTCVGGGSLVNTVVAFPGDGNWFWVLGACTIAAANTSTVQVYTTVDSTHPLQVYRPFVIKVASPSGLSATELTDEIVNLGFGPSSSAGLGDIVFPADKKLCLPSSNATDENCAYFTHFNTANRTYSLPDASGNVLISTSDTNIYSAYDNFNRANGGLGANWTTPSGENALTITGNQVLGGTAAVVNHQYWNANTFSNDTFTEATVVIPPVGSDQLGVTGRVSTIARTYYIYVCGLNVRALTKAIAGTYTTLTSTGTGCSAGDVIRLETNGSTINGFRNGVLDLTASDSAITSGGVGMFTVGTGGVADNWSGGYLHPLAHLDIEQDLVQPQHITTALTIGPVNPVAGSLVSGNLYATIGLFTTSVATGATPPNCTAGGGTAGTECLSEGTLTTNTAGTDLIFASSTTHELGVLTNGATTNPGTLVRSQPSPVVQTAQTAPITTASLCASAAGACNVAGQYHIHVNEWGSGTACSNVTAGGTTFSLTWTDEAAVAHAAVVVPLLAQTTATAMALQSSAPTFPFQTALANEGASGDITISTNGSIIQYAVAYTPCTTGTGTYNLRASVTRIQ